MPLLPASQGSRPSDAVDTVATHELSLTGQPACQLGKPRLWDRMLQTAVMRRLDGMQEGRIEIIDSGTRRSFGTDSSSALVAEIQVNDPRFYRHLALGGNLGAAEAFIRGYWECDDLVNLVRILCRNRIMSRKGNHGLARLAAPLRRAGHLLRRNSVGGNLAE